MTDQFSPALLRSPAFLLVALIAGRATHDKALERLAARQLADLGIRVNFGSDLLRPAKRKGVMPCPR
jgi:hypothetical protein